MFIKLFIIFTVLILVYGLYNSQNKGNNNNENFIQNTDKEIKINAIIPTIQHLAEKDDIINFFFFMQDYYVFNPQAYEEAIDNVNELFKVYNIIKTEPDQNINYYYSVAVSKKDNALNSMHSLIYMLPDNCKAIKKFNESLKRLNVILNKYVHELYVFCMNETKINGYDVTKRIINPINYPREYNIYFDTAKDFTYQFL